MSHPIDTLLTQAADNVAAAQNARFRGRHVDAEANMRTARNVLNALCDVIAGQHITRDPASLTLSDSKPTTVIKAHPRHAHANV